MTAVSLTLDRFGWENVISNENAGATSTGGNTDPE